MRQEVKTARVVISTEGRNLSSIPRFTRDDGPAGSLDELGGHRASDRFQRSCHRISSEIANMFD
jgi:hypothetical protein